MLNKAKILIVDDDQQWVTTLAFGLTKAGYDVLATENGDDAVQIVSEHHPALALLDIEMEGKSGHHLASVLRERYRLPFIFLSLQKDESTVRKARSLWKQGFCCRLWRRH